MMAIVVAVVLGALEWRAVRANMGAEWNGYGAMLGTLRRDNAAPMRYRVLVPWVLVGLAKVFRFRITPAHYQVAKVALLAGALAVAEALLGMTGMLALAVLVAATFEFDYWDCYAELLGAGLVLSGSPWMAALGGLVWGLSRETAMIAPVLGLLAGGPWCGLAAGLGPVALAAVRLVQGRTSLYCERWELKVYNAPDLAGAWRREDVGPYFSLLWSVGTLAAVVWGRGRMPGALAATAGVAPVWLAAGWLMARGREMRMFMPCALWMAACLGD